MLNSWKLLPLVPVLRPPLGGPAVQASFDGSGTESFLPFCPAVRGERDFGVCCFPVCVCPISRISTVASDANCCHPQSSAARNLVALLMAPPGLTAGSQAAGALRGDKQVAWVPRSPRGWGMKAEEVLQ